MVMLHVEYMCTTHCNNHICRICANTLQHTMLWMHAIYWSTCTVHFPCPTPPPFLTPHPTTTTYHQTRPLEGAATYYNTLQHTLTDWTTKPSHKAVRRRSTSARPTTHCNALQHTVNTLRHTTALQHTIMGLLVAQSCSKAQYVRRPEANACKQRHTCA